MPQTLVQKILGRASGRAQVEPGEVIWAAPDLTTMPEVSYPAYVKRLADIGIDRLVNPERIVVAIDHETPAHSVAAAERNRLTRQLAVKMAIGHLFDSEGITHPLTVERGLVLPGMFVAGADTHTPGLGGVGALAMPFGIEVTMIMAIGRIWLKVPQTIHVRVHGTLRPGVSARDIVLHTMRLIGPDEANECVVEYSGEAIAALGVPERMTISGLTVDMGADAGLVAADSRTVDYLRAAGVADPQILKSDADALFASAIDIDASTLEPLVSVPPSPTHVRSAAALSGVQIQHAYIGSCASGSLAELRAAAALLAGRRVHRDVQLLVIPATRRVHEQAMTEGVLGTLMAAGAQIAGSTCGPCFGGLAQLAAGEVRISTSTRNDPGRMGSAEAQIYLASALTVAASALAGHIADPREYLHEVHS
ncbi:aconitase/3-isopropylmalate dehydratase large subunit family protein [Caballeronia sp. LjRoot29]|uniref:3-isopropylmalate dehydratase large subunit n=1 Tax=Caballeronia sp. LjRoot29 TaxID=3342315 RepID=UPI003ECEE5F4